MPLTTAGEKVLANMKHEYGEPKAERVFYSSINAHKPGSSGWHQKVTDRVKTKLRGGHGGY